MKKKENCKIYNELKRIFAKRCKDMRDDEDVKTEDGESLNKSMSMGRLAKIFTNMIEQKYTASKISRIENAEAEISLLDLFLYSKHYNVSYNFLMGESINKEEKYFMAKEKYGLTDKTLDVLSFMSKEDKYSECLKALNDIFESGFTTEFLTTLYDYFYKDYNNCLPEDYKIMGGEQAILNISAEAGEIDLGKHCVSLGKLNLLNRQYLYDTLEDMKRTLNKKKSTHKEIIKQKENSIKILDNLYKNK